MGKKKPLYITNTSGYIKSIYFTPDPAVLYIVGNTEFLNSSLHRPLLKLFVTITVLSDIREVVLESFCF
jgi:hypothetical protein